RQKETISLPPKSYVFPFLSTTSISPSMRKEPLLFTVIFVLAIVFCFSDLLKFYSFGINHGYPFAHFFLNNSKMMLVFGCNKRNCLPGRFCPTRSSYTMNVIFRRSREFVIYNTGQILY